MLLRRLLPIVVMLTLIVPAGASAQAPGPAPRDVALKLSDIPHGFVEDQSDLTTNAVYAQVHGLSLSAVAHLGRVTGYQVMFSRATTTGACCISNDIGQYQTGAEARQAFERSVATDRRQYASFPGYQQEYADKGRVFLFTFPCRCDNQDRIVDIADTYVGTFGFDIELHYVPRTASSTSMWAAVERYVNLVSRRITLGADNPTDAYLRGLSNGQYDAFARLSKRFPHSTNYQATYHAYTSAIIAQLNKDYTTVLQHQRAEAVFVGDASRNPMPLFSTLNPTAGPWQATPDPQMTYVEMQQSGSAFGTETVNGVRYRTFYAALPVPPLLRAHHVVAGLIVYQRI